MDELLRHMDTYGIEAALVADFLAREINPVDGNERLVRALAGQERLQPVWAVLPAVSRELPPTEELLQRMQEHGVRAAWLFPDHHYLTLEPWHVDELVGALAAAHIPLFITYGGWIDCSWDKTDWPAVVALCERFPELPVIVNEPRIRRHHRRLLAALAHCPRLHLELSGLWLSRIVETVVDLVGPGRLLFGTFYPVRDPAESIATLTYAAVSDEAKRAIAGGNLRRLLEGVSSVGQVARPASQGSGTGSLPVSATATTPPTGWQPVPLPLAAGLATRATCCDELAESALRGEPLRDEVVVDVHGHLGRFCDYAVQGPDPEDILREYDETGVDVGIIFPIAGVLGESEYGNDLVIEAVRRHPERLLGLGIVNPNHGEAWMRAEMRRFYEAGLKGIKVITHYQNYPENGPLVELAAAFAHEHHLVALNHHWDAAQLDQWAAQYPDAAFICGHLSLDAAPTARRRDNVLICTCLPISFGHMAHAVEVAGADKLAFGSDVTDLPIATGLGPILMAPISIEDKRRILGLNALALLKRCDVGGLRLPAV